MHLYFVCENVLTTWFPLPSLSFLSAKLFVAILKCLSLSRVVAFRS